MNSFIRNVDLLFYVAIHTSEDGRAERKLQERSSQNQQRFFRLILMCNTYFLTDMMPPK